MSVIVYIESSDRKLKKNALECASYAVKLAEQLNTEALALTINCDNSESLANVGIQKILKTENTSSHFDVQTHGQLLVAAANAHQAQVVVTSSSADGRYLAPFVAARWQAGYVSNVMALPSEDKPLSFRRSCYSNKAYCDTTFQIEKVVVSLANNAFGKHDKKVTSEIIDFNPEIKASNIGLVSTEKTKGKTNISDADIVVSAGRGLKGPENWGMIEELADVLGAATACSKPVSDMGWRPHSEHVGQTGKPVATNLYIAIGISGAIQHLAGVNASKVKLVINNDPEAPFFKAADYGVVGDAFEVVPKLIEKLKVFKQDKG